MANTLRICARLVGAFAIACGPPREVQRPIAPMVAPTAEAPPMTPPPAPTGDATFRPLTATLADGEGRSLPVVDYCMHAIATTTAAHGNLRWAGAPPTVGSGELLLLLGPATWQCAFIGGAGGPRVHHVERRGHDVVVHVTFPEPFKLTWSAALVPRPAPSGRLVLVVHGSIMQPPGDWEKATEHLLAIDAPLASSAPPRTTK